MKELRQILYGLREAPSPVGIVSHINPDGDGFCASLFLAKWLDLQGQKSVIITDGDDLQRFSHLLGDATVLPYEDDMACHTLVVLDCNNLDRLGQRFRLVHKAQRIVLIDHHEVENKLIEADYSYIDQSFVCVGAILFCALEADLQMYEPGVKSYLGSCLYTTVLNDTNTFTNGNTTAKVLDIAARISTLGINPHRLHRDYFQNRNWNELRYTGQSLATIEVYKDGRILVLCSTLKMAQENGITPGDVLNVTRWVTGVKNIEGVIYIREESPDYHKLSFRSHKVDVSSFAGRYGGGGHQNAAGCHLEGGLKEVKERVVKDFIQALEEADGGKAR